MMPWSPQRHRPEDIRSQLPLVRNAPTPPGSVQPVDFVAPCPGCGRDVWWHARPGPTGEMTLCRPPEYVIDCDC